MAKSDYFSTPLLPDLDLPGLDPFGHEAVEKPNQPTPRTFRRIAREKFARGLKKQTLKELLPAPPAPGECIHVVSNGTYDYFTFIPLMLDWIGTADVLYGSTWTMNRGNVNDLLAFYDAGRIRQITLATGNYFLRRESAVAATILQGLRERGQRFCCWENHAKTILLSNAEKNAWYVVEGSANWTANPRTEQNILLNDRATWEFHAAWLEEMFGKVPPPTEAGHARPVRMGFSQRRAGLGVLSVRADRESRDRILAWKGRREEDDAETGRLANELAALVAQALPVRPAGCVLTVPPQGASAPGTYFARLLGRRVATRLSMPLVEILARTDTKRHHGVRPALAQSPYEVTLAVPAAVVIDDLTTSGASMRLSLDALKQAGIPAWAFAYGGV